MTTAGLLGADAFLILIGAGVLVVLGTARTTGALARRVALAPAVGLALVGIVGAVTEPLHVGVTPLLLFGLALVSVVAGGALLHRGPGPDTPVWSNADRLVAAVAGVCLAAVAVVAALTFRVKPIAEYDSWAMWALKGRALAAFGWATPDVFDGDAYRALHLEYPLLLPVLHAIGIRAAGTYEGRIVILQCLVIGVAGLLALWGALYDRVRPAILLPGLLAVALAPGLFEQLSTGYADVPLALFVAVATVTAARWLVDPAGHWLVLATIFLTAGAMTKNEGLLFAAATYAGLLLTAQGRRLHVVASGLALGAMMLPWRIQVSQQSAVSGTDFDLSSPLGGAGLSTFLNRGTEAAWRLLGYALDTSRFGLLLPLALLAALTAAFTGATRIGLFLTAYLIVGFAGLTWIYAISPLELDSYLRQSGDRVITGIVLAGAAAVPLLVDELLSTRRDAKSPRGSSSG